MNSKEKEEIELEIKREMENSVTQDGIATVLANQSLDSSSVRPGIVVQVVDLKPAGNRYT